MAKHSNACSAARSAKPSSAGDRATSSRTPNRHDGLVAGEADAADAADPPVDPIGETATSEAPSGSATQSGEGERTRYRSVEVGSRLGRLELLELLGEGGMATVFRARDSGLRRDVAVKVLFPHLARKPEVVSRFHREARAAAALDHPNILRVLDVGGGPSSEDASGRCDPPFMVLELIEGGSLRDISEDREPMLAESVAAIGAILCRALAVAHDAGIIHRDIKPANIMAMMTSGGAPRIVIADFGVAHVAEEDSVVTRTGALLGTPAYMSPEQAAADPLDPRSDLYSVGATLYRLVTGVMPFVGSTPRVVMAIMAGELTPVLRRRPATGPDLAKVIERLMKTAPADRYADARAAEAALLAVLEASGISLDDAIEAGISGSNEALGRDVLQATLRRAEAAATAGRVPTAIALADRALALDSKNARALALVDSLAGHGRKPWLLIAAALAALAAGAVGLVIAGVLPGFGGRGEAELAAGAADVVLDASLMAIAPIARDASVSDRELDGSTAAAGVDERAVAAAEKLAARERAAAEKLAARERRNNLADSSAARAVAIDAGVVAAAPIDAAVVATAPPKHEKPAAQGSVAITVPTWCNVTVGDGESQMVNRKRTLSLPVGRHSIVCAQPSTGMRERKTVEVKAGQTAGVDFALTVKVTVQIGDGIELDGKLIKTGSSFTTPPKRMKVTVVRGSERASTYVTIRGDCTLKGSPLRCVE